MKKYSLNSKHNLVGNISYQAGLSIIELMISITLGVLLIAGVATNFIGAKESDKMRSAISEMDANARVAIGILRQSILHAGYPSMYNVRLDKPFYTASDGVLTNPRCRGGSVRRDLQTPSWSLRTRDSGRTDVITVISLADNPCKTGSTCPNTNINPNALVYYDCVGGGFDRRDSRVTECSADPKVGMKDPTQAKIYSSFWVNRSRNLYCRGSRGNTQPLVQDIEAMQVLYGVKQDDGSLSYRRATDVEASDQWSLVRSVQIALLVRSSTEVLKTPSDKIWYTLLDVRRRIATSDLRRLFRVYTTTINLENVKKGALL